MKRVQSLLIFFILLALLVTACATPSAPTSAPAPSGGEQSGGAASNQQIKLSFYYPVAVPGPITQIIDGYMADFTKENPNITVEPVLAGGYQDSMIKILTTLQGGGQPPDLAVLLSTDMWTLIDSDAIIPLDDCVAKIGGQDYLNDFFPAFMLNSQANGKTWGIPFQRSTPVLYYNKQAFQEAGLDPEKPPANWDELVEYGKKLTKTDASGNVVQWGLEIPSDGFPYWLFQSFAIENGQNVVGDDPSAVNFNAPSTVEALDFVVSLSKEYKIMPEGIIQWSNAPNDFTSGKAAMIYHTTGSLTNILKQASFPVGVAFHPAKKTYGAPTGGGNLYIFKDTPPEKQEAACKLIKFLTTPERAAQWSIDTGYVATRKSAYDTQAMKDLIAQHPQYLVARDQLEYAQRELSGHNGAELQKILGDAIQAAILGNKTSQQALDDAQAKADQMLAQFK